MSIGEYKLSEKNSTHGLLHTPEGVRDLYNIECRNKRMVEQNIHDMLELYHFQDIETPTFEYFDIFNKERGTIASKDMYKFFDKEGNTLVLRPDFTPSIARCAAKYFKEEELPIRLCYRGNTFINATSYQGKLKEVTQLGAELINDRSVDADAEMIALTIECLQKAGLKDFQLEIGHADFFNGILEEANMNEEESMELKNLIESKNLFGVEELIKSKKLDKTLEELILKIPELFGDAENLAYAHAHVHNERSIRALDRLVQLNEILKIYGLEKYISFDLGMLSKYNYYTGIIFRGYTYGTGDVIVTGGRYDNLVGQFGKEAPAIGFAIVMDQVMLALGRQKVELKADNFGTMILYDINARKTAIQLGKELRKAKTKVELVRKSSKRSLEEYIGYGEKNQMARILYIEGEDGVKEINIMGDRV